MTSEHEKWDELAVGHVLSALEPEDEEIFARHLRGCSLCLRTITEMTAVASHLAYAAPPSEPPAELKDSIFDAVRRTGRPPALPNQRPGLESISAGSASSRVFREPSRWVRALSMAAGVIVIVGLGLWNVNLRATAELSQQAVARLERVERLTADPSTLRVAMTSGSGAKGTALVRGSEVVTLVNGLPKNDPNSIYVVWYQDETGGFHAMDTFDVREADHVNVVESTLDRPVSGIVALAISKEPGRKAPLVPSYAVVQGKTGQAVRRA